MNRKVLGAVLLGLGALLVIAAVVVMAVIVPGMKQFPDDVDTTRRYAGDMPVLLNPETFEFMKDLKIDLERHFMTEAVDGDVALVLEEQTLSSGGQPLQQLVKRHVIDRKTMEWASDYPSNWAEKEGFWPRQGLVMGWPIDTEKKDYTGWSDDYRTTITLKYEKEEERGGIDTYYFTSSGGPLPIDPAAVVQMQLPAALPKEQFQALIGTADVPESIKAVVPMILSAIEGDNVPLKYYYEYQAEYWIEPQTGVLIDTKKTEIRKVGLGDEVLEAVPLLANLPEEQQVASRVTVSSFTYQGVEQTLKDAKNDAEDAISQIQLYGTTLPLVAIVAGAVLALVGIFLLMRKA